MTQFASDTFTGTDGTTLQVHSANWVKHPALASDWVLVNNKARNATAGNDLSTYYRTESPATADYEVNLDILINNTSTTSLGGPSLRVAPTVNTQYVAYLDPRTGLQKFVLRKIINGSETNLGSSASTFSANDNINVRIKATGSTIELFKALEATPLISVTDSSITAAGKPGFWHFGGANDMAGEHFDNFSADEEGGATSVFTDEDLRWSMLQSSTQDSTLQWGVLQSQEQSSTLQWALVQATVGDMDTRWSVLSATASDLQVDWALLQSVLAVDPDLRWNIGIVTSPVEMDSDLRWFALQDAANSLDARWDMRVVVIQDSEQLWSVLQSLGVSVDARWSLLSHAQRDTDLRWTLQSDVIFIPSQRTVLVLQRMNRLLQPERANRVLTLQRTHRILH